jgi:myosin-18
MKNPLFDTKYGKISFDRRRFLTFSFYFKNQEEELEDARAATQKKVKALEQQLENEHEERINFVREKHELETKIINLQEMASRSADEEQVSKLKKDLKRTKALLKDAQLMIERSKSDSSNKVVMRQLKNQVRCCLNKLHWRFFQ